MSHFNAKTLSFYGIAISSVLLLFKIVSTYGETKLKAAPNINGTYELAKAENLPQCLQNRQLVLNIEQSGIYLFGNLASQPESNPESIVEIPLKGDFKKNQIIMSSKSKLSSCETEINLTLQKEQAQDWLGKIKDNNTGSEGVFVAKYQPAKEAKSSQAH